jgi:hypothetical protein
MKKKKTMREENGGKIVKEKNQWDENEEKRKMENTDETLLETKEKEQREGGYAKKKDRSDIHRKPKGNETEKTKTKTIGQKEEGGKGNSLKWDSNKKKRKNSHGEE